MAEPGLATDMPTSPVVSRQTWRHLFGESEIVICEDGTVLIDGKTVRDTLPQNRQGLASGAGMGDPLPRTL